MTKASLSIDGRLHKLARYRYRFRNRYRMAGLERGPSIAMAIPIAMAIEHRNRVGR